MNYNVSFCAKPIHAAQIEQAGKELSSKVQEAGKVLKESYTSPFAPTGTLVKSATELAELANQEVINTRIPFNVLEAQARRDAEIASKEAAKLAAKEAQNAYPPAPFN